MYGIPVYRHLLLFVLWVSGFAENPPQDQRPLWTLRSAWNKTSEVREEGINLWLSMKWVVRSTLFIFTPHACRRSTLYLQTANAANRVIEKQFGCRRHSPASVVVPGLQGIAPASGSGSRTAAAVSGGRGFRQQTTSQLYPPQVAPPVTEGRSSFPASGSQSCSLRRI